MFSAGKKLLLYFLPAFILLACSTRAASAHFLQWDGAVTVILHANPDDDPIIGRPATLLFDVNDGSGHFDPNACSCSIAVSEGGKTIAQGDLHTGVAQPSIYNFSFPLVFPDKAVYNIVVSGKPKRGSSIPIFHVTYNFRIDREADLSAAPPPPAAKSSKIYPAIFISAVLAVVGATLFVFNKSLKKQI